MTKEQAIAGVLTAHPEQLAKIEAVLTGTADTPHAPPADRRLLTFTETAATVGLSRMTIQRMVEDGRLQAIETRAGRYRIASAEITRFLTGGK